MCLIPSGEAADRPITDQMSDSYAYDLDERRVVRLDPNLPDTLTFKDEAGNGPTRPRPRHHPPRRPPNRPRRIRNPNLTKCRPQNRAPQPRRR